MTLQRLLTPDRWVQDSPFGDAWDVLVSFHMVRPDTNRDEKYIAPKSFATYQWQ